MVTRKHVKIVSVLTLVFGVMTIVALALHIAGIWPVWPVFAHAFAMNSLGLLSHVLTTELLHRETHERIQNVVMQTRIIFEKLQKALVFPDHMAKLRKDYLSEEAAGMFMSLLESDKSPVKPDTHVYTFRIGSCYEGNPVFMSVPVNMANPCKNIRDLDPKLLLDAYAEEIAPAANKLVAALLKDRDYYKFSGDLTVDILPAEQK